MHELSGFTFSKIVIIQSLEPEEVQTGQILSDYISGLPGYMNYQPPITVINCKHANQFLEILQDLTQDAAAGDIPLLHIECHGNIKDGLEFENSSTLSWDRLSAALIPLNIATRFNLLAVFSACFGAHFVSQIEPIEPSPCWCLVAPTERVGVDELLQGFRVFYSALINDNDMGAAVRSISNCRLSHGRWLSKPAELWFEQLVTGYVKTHCTEPAARKRAQEMYRELKRKGNRCSLGSLIRMLRKRNRQCLHSDYFDNFFMISQIPENFLRFETARNRIVIKIEEFRHSGKYVI